MSDSSLRPLPVILGPTGSGKSDLSLYIAQAVDAEIVNCDSLQVYRGFDIGTAKLPLAERRNIPHHLIDILEPTELFTAGDYARRAEAAIRDISARGRTPVLVGGTGFYLRALLAGLSPAPVRNDAIRARLLERERRRPGSLHRLLRRLDPASSARIHSHDKNKTMRALEVRLVHGSSLTSVFESGRAALAGFTPVKIGLDPTRDALYIRNERTRQMFYPLRAESLPAESLTDEVRRLLSSGVPPQAKPFESLGYKQVLEMLEGRITPQQALESTQQETRRYAKRQQTWFRKEQGVHWLTGFGDEPRVQTEALAILRSVRGH